MSLASVRRFQIEREHVEQTDRALRSAGLRGNELFVLWSGQETDPGIITIKTVHIPNQTSITTPTGLLVTVDGEELHRINTWLHENDESLVAQVHAHPDDAYHSHTDDTYPIVTNDGGLSIVVPNFAARGLRDRRTALYRLLRTRWVQVTRSILEVL